MNTLDNREIIGAMRDLNRPRWQFEGSALEMALEIAFVLLVLAICVMGLAL